MGSFKNLRCSHFYTQFGSQIGHKSSAEKKHNYLIEKAIIAENYKILLRRISSSQSEVLSHLCILMNKRFFKI
jgi:hypothetical protein